MYLKVSKPGIKRVKQARREKGWATNDATWLEQASQLVDPALKKLPPYANGISYGTWTRFLAGKAVNIQALKAYCTVLGIDWEEVIDRAQTPIADMERHWDWNEAPDTDLFYGRTTELMTLNNWTVQDRCRLVGVFGIGGIGKTALVAKLAIQVQADFEYIIWRTLSNISPIDQFLLSVIKFFSQQQETELSLPQDLNGKIRRLLDYLRQHRCLLVLDGLDAILQSSAGSSLWVGAYRAGYEGYGQLLRQVGESFHQSCLLLTSREKPLHFVSLEGDSLPTRSLQLTGLNAVDSKKVLQLKGQLVGSESEWKFLIDRYAGHPLALKVVGAAAQELFCSSISAFLQQKITIFGGIRYLLDQQFNRLSELEKEIMYWLAIRQEPVSVTGLLASLISPVCRQQVLEAIAALKRRFLIETSPFGYTQQPLIVEYITERLVQQVYTEITTQKLALLTSHALIQAQAKDDIKVRQVCVILAPLAERLRNAFKTKGELEEKLQQLVRKLPTDCAQPAGYGAENLMNLLHFLHGNLPEEPFSGVAMIPQRSLQRIWKQEAAARPRG
ncbi:MAG: NB-ARC domain-containing protein [Cyanophyceae cyanobacterium]